MHKRYRDILFLTTGLLLLCAPLAGATEVWSGPTKIFSKISWDDWTQEGAQDRITPNVWLTRGDYMGLFNIILEDEFDNDAFKSPLDTEWAAGNAEDWMILEFSTWDNWHGACPPCALETDAVIHLITDDIYIDIVILEWTQGEGDNNSTQTDLGDGAPGPFGGGGFTYIRATSPVSPVDGATLSMVKSLY